MDSPSLAAFAEPADASEIFRDELAAFVATNKRERPRAWQRVEQLRRACQNEAPATVPGIRQAPRIPGRAEGVGG